MDTSQSAGTRLADMQQPSAPDGFATALFQNCAHDDVAAYAPEQRATIADQAWSFLSNPHLDSATKPSTNTSARLRLRDVDCDPENPLSFITILEVVNQDRPFLVDSALACLEEFGCKIRLIAHPVFELERDRDGLAQTCQLKAANPQPPHGVGKSFESFIHIHLDRVSDETLRSALLQELAQSFEDVRAAVDDWRAMRAKIKTAIVNYQEAPPLPVDEIAEAIQFLQWLIDDNFTFLGVRELSFSCALGEQQEMPGLGLLRTADHPIVTDSFNAQTSARAQGSLLDHKDILIITKTVVKSRVHRRVYMDYIGIRLFDEAGNAQGEIALVGLLTSDAYTHSTQSIPYIRNKVAQVVRLAQLETTSHAGRTLMSVLESYPRDELFQLDVPTLFDFSRKISALIERPRVCVLARRDLLQRFVSLIVYVPRERFDIAMMHKIGRLFASVSGGAVRDVAPFFPGGSLVRIQYVVSDIENFAALLDAPALEKDITQLLQTWQDGLIAALSTHHGRAQKLMQRYLGAFSIGYQEHVLPQEAVGDIEIIEHLTERRPRAFAITALPATLIEAQDNSSARLKIFSRGDAIALSRCVPVLEAMGFYVVNEYSYEITPNNDEGATKPTIWLHDLTIRHAQNQSFIVSDLAATLESHLAAVFRGDAERDGFCALTLHAGLGWRDVGLVRALARYLRQAAISFSQDYLWTTLNKHAGLTKKLVALFYLRFDPRSNLDANTRHAQEATLLADIEQDLKKVASLDEDRILRRFFNLIQSMVRTNFFQLGKDGFPRTLLSFKFKSGHIDELPKPAPLYEIFVYSPVLEGVHLRFGKVARGGLRWSDRMQDFRTEILGLVKAQQVKNAVIVPVGAKGGFVGKLLPSPSDREAYMREGIAVYRQFVQALLDLTDNIVGDKLIKPIDVLCYDEDDPYLVVAADKGTATFSDTANALSIEHHFWLDDAFASGGSVGYDHKKMGITAKGAWEAVKRHFREMNHDIQTTPFTVVGVGDMSGDVFGNGMLLSPATKLIAAFDHRDIFIDPNPDALTALTERQRLFNLPRSSWQDYDKSLLSKGGGIFPRSAKEITLSPEAVSALGLPQATLSPQQLMQAILRAKVDLLWFGGIGTYIKASSESDDAVGDRANDAIRITSGEVGAKVIGEGANLGMTQRGRIEAGLRGVRLNTDAIDNSAGVNTSDVEVNIKIALSSLRQSGALDDNARAHFLAELTDDVAHLVLTNNYQQTLSLSLTQLRGARENFWLERLMQSLEADGRLDRKIEFLPDDAGLEARTRQNLGLTRPELAVLLAYAKLALNDDLVASSVPDDPFLQHLLEAYFPPKLAKTYPQVIASHRLRREIIATCLANQLINQTGSTGVVRVASETGCNSAAVVRAFIIVHEIFGLKNLNEALDALDTKIDGAVQLALYSRVQNFVLARLVWFVRVLDGAAPLESLLARFAALKTVNLPDLLASLSIKQQQFYRETVKELLDDGVSETLAQDLAKLELLPVLCDGVLVAESAAQDLSHATACLFALQDVFALREIARQARRLLSDDYYEKLARDRALASIEQAVRSLANQILAGAAQTSQQDFSPAQIEAFLAQKSEGAMKAYLMMRDILSKNLSIARLTIIASLFVEIVNS